MEGFKNKKILS